jgi:ketosteroid isomerase-like protein
MRDDALTNRNVLEAAYAAFNARDIDGALAVLHPDVIWANGMEGGYVYGHGGVRDYWARQWGVIDPHVDPLRFDSVAPRRIAVQVHQVVRDLTGTLLSERIVQHVFSFDDAGLITRMEIDPAP